MRLEEFDYELPENQIATAPVEPRDHSRLLAVDRKTGRTAHHRFHEIGGFLRAGDLLVLNNTRVLPARLFGTSQEGREFEVFLLARDSEPLGWKCLARPGKKIKAPTTLTFPDGRQGVLRREQDESFRIVFRDFSSEGAFLDWLDTAGSLPLPPYIKREATGDDKRTYQTVYAKDPGSVAAPTAGLHFTPELLQRLREAGVETAEVTLHIGYGTFSPIRAEEIEDHQMHEESYSISQEAFEKLADAKRQGRRIIAVGTTTLRALESLPSWGPAGRTDIFIRPGHSFKWTDGLITNFHLPKSSLIVLVAAFLGLPQTQAAYAEAVREGYRFFSYGDAMLIL